jgi:hypothetical protein
MKQERGRRERRLGVEIWVLWGMARISFFKSALKILKIHFAISAVFSNCKLLNQWLPIDRESSIQLKKRRITLTVLFTVYFDGLRSLDFVPRSHSYLRRNTKSIMRDFSLAYKYLH